MDEEQGLIIQNNVVVGCNSQLSDVVIPAGVTGIGPRAFRDSSLISVTIPTGLREVGAEAFSGCEWLHKVEFPSGLETVGERAFADCVCLTRVVLPDTLREMSWDAFFGCVMLKKVELSPDNPFWRLEDGRLWKRDGTAFFFLPAMAPEGCCVVPEGIREIPPVCFRDTSVEAITLPDSVEAIREDAMRDCSWLTKLRLPPQLRSLGDRALAGTSLEEVVLPASLRELGTGVFQNATELTRLVVLGELPEGWKTFSLSKLGIQGSEYFDLQADRIPMEKISRGSQPAIVHNFMLRMDSIGDPLPEETRRDRLEFLRRRQKDYRKDPGIRNLLLDEKLVGIKDIDSFLAEATEANDPELIARLLDYQEKYIDREEKARREEKKFKRDLQALTRSEPTLQELKRLWPGRVLEDGSWELRGCGDVPDGVTELDVPAFLKKMPVTAIAAGARL